MAKKYEKIEEVTEEVKPLEDKMTEAIDVLKNQIAHHNMMATKAQGALEVLLQINEEINESTRINGEGWG